MRIEDIFMGQLSYKKQKIVIIILFLFIPVILLAAFTYYPAFKLFQLSFTDWNGATPAFHYIGISNYIDLFKDTDTLITLQNNLAYVLIMLIQTVVGLYFAIILNGKIKARNLFKSIIFMPYILNGVAIAFMFSYMYNYNDGPFNVLLRSIGLGRYAIRWLGDSYYINFSLALIGMWRYTGFMMVIFLAALQSVPKELYESSSLDGANYFQNIRYITIPSIKRIIELNLFLGFNGALQAFFEPFVLTQGGPAGRSDTFVTATLKIAFNFENFGKASAMGIVLMALILMVVGIQKIVLGREDKA